MDLSVQDLCAWLLKRTEGDWNSTLCILLAKGISLLHCGGGFLEKITHLLSRFVNMEINFSLVLHEQKQKNYYQITRVLNSLASIGQVIERWSWKANLELSLLHTTQLITKQMTTEMIWRLNWSQLRDLLLLIAESNMKSVSAKYQNISISKISIWNIVIKPFWRHQTTWDERKLI